MLSVECARGEGVGVVVTRAWSFACLMGTRGGVAPKAGPAGRYQRPRAYTEQRLPRRRQHGGQVSPTRCLRAAAVALSSAFSRLASAPSLVNEGNAPGIGGHGLRGGTMWPAEVREVLEATR